MDGTMFTRSGFLLHSDEINLNLPKIVLGPKMIYLGLKKTGFYGHMFTGSIFLRCSDENCFESFKNCFRSQKCIFFKT